MKHWKRLLCLITAVSLLLGSFPFLVSALDEGVTADGFLWQQGGSKTCYVTGYKGSEKNIVIPTMIEGYTVSAIQIDAFKGSDIESVVMKSNVNYICQRAFMDCASLRSVVTSDTVEELQNSAFENCTALTDVTIPAGATKGIGKQVFMGCTSLESIVIPEGVKTIDNNAFNGCKSLKSVELPSTLQTIGNSVFAYCESFCTMTIPEGLRSIGSWCFRGVPDTAVITVSTVKAQKLLIAGEFVGTIVGAPIENPADYEYRIEGDSAIVTAYKGNDARVSVPAELGGKTVTAIDAGVFKNNRTLERIYLNVPLLSVGDSCFEGCTALNLVSFPEDFAAIGARAFYGCTALKTVTVPMSVTAIGKDAFGGLSTDAVVSVTMPEVQQLLLESGYKGKVAFVPENDPADYTLMDGSGGTLVKAYSGSKSKISIPGKMSELDGGITTGIIAYGMANHNDLTSVIVPDTVTWIGAYGFCNCPNLTKLVLPRKLANITEHMVEGAQSLTSIEIPPTVQEIGDFAFCSCYSLTSITLPEGVTYLGEEAFADCRALKEITLPSTLNEIGKNVWRGIPQDAVITVPTMELYQKLKASGCTVSIRITGVGIDNTTDISIGDDHTAKGDGKSGKYTGSATGLIIPAVNGEKTATTFPAQLLYKNIEVTSVTVSEGITTIPSSAFSGCTALRVLSLPSTLTKIGSSAFKSMPTDAVITVPNQEIYDLVISANWTGTIEGVTSADPALFTFEQVPDSSWEAQITGYTGTADKVAIPESVTVGESVLTVTKIADGAFKSSAITQVTLPDTVLALGTEAFADCTALRQVRLSERMTDVAAAAFRGCTALEEIVLPDSIVLIGGNAFRGAGLKKLTLPGYLTEIGAGAFAESTLPALALPDTVKKIGTGAFPGTLTLSAESQAVGKLITQSGFKGTVEGIPVTRLEDYEYVFTQNNTRVTITKYKGTDSIIAVPETISGIPVRGINHSAFAFNEHLVRVYLPDTVTIIGNNVFEGCVNVEYIHLPKELTEFGSRAFQMMVSLRELEIPDGVSVIPYHSCRFLFSLRKLTLPKNVAAVQDTAFYFDSALREIYLSETVTAVGTNTFTTNTTRGKLYCSEQVAGLLSAANCDAQIITEPAPPISESTPTYFRFNSEKELSRLYTLPGDGTVITFDKKEQAAKISVSGETGVNRNPGAVYLFSDGQSEVYDTHLSVADYPYLLLTMKISDNKIKSDISQWVTTYARQIRGKDIHPGRGNETFIDTRLPDYRNTSEYQNVVISSTDSDFFSGNWVSAGLRALGKDPAADACVYLKEARVLSEAEYYEYISSGGSSAAGTTLIDFSLESNFGKMNWSDQTDTYAEYQPGEGAAYICARDAAVGSYADGALNQQTAYFDVSFASVPVTEYPILALRLKVKNPGVAAGWFGFKTTDSIKDDPTIFCDILKPVYANTTEWQTVIIDCSKNNMMGHLFTGNWLGAAFNLTFTGTATEKDAFLVEWAGIFRTVEEAIAAGQSTVKTYTPPKQEEQKAAPVEEQTYESTEELQIEPQNEAEYEIEEKVRRIKKKKSVYIPGKDYTAITVIASVGGGVLLAATAILIIILAKRKKKREEETQ